MKTSVLNKLSLAAALVGLGSGAMTVRAQDTVPNTPAAAASPVASVAPAISPAGTLQLSYGVPQVVQLAQAQVSESTIITYIKSSGNSYGLDANQIIYLRQQGISDAVIGAMLTQPKAGASGPGSVVATSAGSAPSAPATSTVVYDQPAPAYVPASTVYVIPDTATYRYDSTYYRYYGYPCYSPFSVNIGFGGRFGGGWGGYHGGWHGGWHH